VENPRETEYRLFGQVTRALIEAEKLPLDEVQKRADVLDWNRRVWTALSNDCSSRATACRPSCARRSSRYPYGSAAHQRRDAPRGRDRALIEINRIHQQLALYAPPCAPRAPASAAQRMRPTLRRLAAPRQH
jgi:hypothetical protein